MFKPEENSKEAIFKAEDFNKESEALNEEEILHQLVKACQREVVIEKINIPLSVPTVSISLILYAAAIAVCSIPTVAVVLLGRWLMDGPRALINNPLAFMGVMLGLFVCCALTYVSVYGFAAIFGGIAGGHFWTSKDSVKVMEDGLPTFIQNLRYNDRINNAQIDVSSLSIESIQKKTFDIMLKKITLNHQTELLSSEELFTQGNLPKDALTQQNLIEEDSPKKNGVFIDTLEKQHKVRYECSVESLFLAIFNHLDTVAPEWRKEEGKESSVNEIVNETKPELLKLYDPSNRDLYNPCLNGFLSFHNQSAAIYKDMATKITALFNKDISNNPNEIEASHKTSTDVSTKLKDATSLPKANAYTTQYGTLSKN